MIIKRLAISEGNKLVCNQKENRQVVPVQVINGFGFGVTGFRQDSKQLKIVFPLSDKKIIPLQKLFAMSTIELREMIINQLAHINDTSFLKAIKTLVDSKAEAEVYKLSDYQKERIQKGREQLIKGQTISHDELQKEIDQWLESK